MALMQTTCHKCHKTYSGPWHTCNTYAAPLSTSDPSYTGSLGYSSGPYITCFLCGMAYQQGSLHSCLSSYEVQPNGMISSSLTEVSDRIYNALWTRCDDLDLATARLEAKIDKLTEVLSNLLEKL